MSSDRIKPGAALPDDTEVAELITMLVRFRTQAVAAVVGDAGLLDRVDHRVGGRSDPRRPHREGGRHPKHRRKR